MSWGSRKCFSSVLQVLSKVSYASGSSRAMRATGLGVRVPATTSSPCAFTR